MRFFSERRGSSLTQNGRKKPRTLICMNSRRVYLARPTGIFRPISSRNIFSPDEFFGGSLKAPELRTVSEKSGAPLP